MPIKVLVVDDSSFFRRRIIEVIGKSTELEVIDSAVNGKEAVEKALKLKPDVITMDVEMPLMDGIAATAEIMSIQPIPILMLSTLTREGADATLRSLEAGAVDYFPKRFEEIAQNQDDAMDILRERVKTVARSHVRKIPKKTAKALDGKIVAKGSPRKSNGKYDLVVIGTSTGGPPALQELIGNLPSDFPLPIVIVQHMPAAFTGAFAKRLHGMSKINVKEAENGDELSAGFVYVAPGGKQLEISKKGMKGVLRVSESDPKYNYRPCVDVTLNSLIENYGKKSLVVILTGMGSDGCKGATELKKLGAKVWAQDQETCVVYGMPAAVVNAGVAEAVLPLKDIAGKLAKEV